MSEYRREIRFEAGHDCMRFVCKHGSPDCKPHSGGSHGCSGLSIRFLLIGEAGAVQFLLYTGWLPEPGDYPKLWGGRGLTEPLPADLGYHALAPRYEDQKSMGPCDVLDGRECYYDGSGLNAYPAFRELCNGGHAALWEYLEKYYRCTFGGEPFPDSTPYQWAPR